MKKQIALLAMLAATVSAQTYNRDYVSGLQTNFYITDAAQTAINVSAGLAFDPTSRSDGAYDRIYLVNRSSSNTKRGLYLIDIANGTYSGRQAMGGEAANNDFDSPCGVAVDSSGIVYMATPYTPGVWKITDPSGVATESQLLGNYGSEGDDDPSGLQMVPGGFGWDCAAGSVLVYDTGFNDNDHNAITIVDSRSTIVAPQYSIIWSEANTVSFRAAASGYDGQVYVAHYDLDVDELNGTTNAYVFRLDSAGNSERIFLDIDPAAAPRLDDAIAVNPADGSLWMVIVAADATRDVFRVDVANAVAADGGFLAETTLVIEDLGYNIGAYSMAFSPDGAQLALGQPDGQDQIHVYSTIPEPRKCLLLIGSANPPPAIPFPGS